MSGRAVGFGLLVTALVAVVGPGVRAQEAPAGPEIVLSGENNRLNAYDAATGEKHTVIPSAADDPVAGLDINAELCPIPDGPAWKTAGERWFIAGEDTEQNTVEGVIKQGWGIFRLTGGTLTELGATELGKLVPDSFLNSESNPENFGCGILPDGRLVTGDVGGQLPTEPATGELIVWFPSADHFTGPVEGGDRTTFARVPHCKIDVGIGTAGGIEIDGTDVLIASNRPNVETAEPGGIYRYDSTVWPTGETPAEGCGRTDPTGEQLADADKVGKELFIPQVPGLLTTPSDIVHSGRDTYFISSVFTGQVAEYGKDGVFKRFVVATTGQVGGITPFGIGVTGDGTLWVADIGVQGPGPAPGAGSVVRVRFDESDEPGDPETIDENLEFPDGIGVIRLPAAAQPAPPTTAPATTTGAPSSAPSGTLPATGAALPAAIALGLLAAGLVAKRSVRVG